MRDIATFYIPGTNLHTETNREFIVALEGPLAKLMVKIEPKLYREYVTVNIK